MITREQCRAARALLDWSQTRLSSKADVGESTIRNFEKGRRVQSDDELAAIRAALETAGVEFVPGDGQPGVRLKKVVSPAQFPEGEAGIIEQNEM